MNVNLFSKISSRNFGLIILCTTVLVVINYPWFSASESKSPPTDTTQINAAPVAAIEQTANRPLSSPLVFVERWNNCVKDEIVLTNIDQFEIAEPNSAFRPISELRTNYEKNTSIAFRNSVTGVILVNRTSSYYITSRNLDVDEAGMMYFVRKTRCLAFSANVNMTTVDAEKLVASIARDGLNKPAHQY